MASSPHHKVMNGNGPVIKCGILCKRSVIKRKAFQTQNYKRRVFELTDSVLAYFDGDIQSKGRQKGAIPLKSMKVVMEVDDHSLEEKCNVFQIVYAEKEDYCTMYVVAQNKNERQAWLDAVRKAALETEAKFFEKYHPGVWTKKKPYYDCCHQSDRNAIGCKHDSLRPRVDSSSRQPPLPPPRPERPSKETYVAMFDYTPTDDMGLELIQGEQYTIIDSSAENWWYAENRQGEKGYIPSNYIRKNCGLEMFEWYYKDCSRERSKTLLLNAAQEGCFLIRDSVSCPGQYTLSIYTTEQGGTVRHYQIKRDESGLYYISKEHPQATIQELVHYHKHNAGGIYTRLRSPPPRGNKPQTAGLAHGKWSLDPKRLTIGRELGRGHFGVVHEGTYLNGQTQLPVAIKKMSVKPSSDEVLQEFKTMTFLAHPNLVQLYGVILDKTPQMIITELLSYGDLSKYLQENRQMLFYSTNKLLDFGIQVCRGMQYLDKKNIIHRDLAARNCLVGSDNVIKIGDFGLARMVLDDDEYQMSEGTKFPFKWAPPEVLYQRKYSSKSDVWAYGILLWEIYSLGDMPYAGMRNPEVLKYVAEQDKRLSKPKLCAQIVYSLMMQCWERDPTRRPTFTNLRDKLEPMVSRSDYIWTEALEGSERTGGSN